MEDELIREQIDYYRRRAGEYDATAYGDLGAADRRIARIVDAAIPAGVPTLELACGTGMWTQALARRTDDLTAVDAAPETLAIARERSPSVRFICADILQWMPSRRYDVVFFSAWLSHVPLDRWAGFFELLSTALVPDGRVVFIDEHPAVAPKERSAGTHTALRTLSDGSTHRIVKVFIDPAETEQRLAELGWTAEVQRDGTDWVVGTCSL